MIIAAAMLYGVVLGWLAGGSLHSLSRVSLRGEVLLLVALPIQVLLPTVIGRLQLPDGLVWWLWMATFAVVLGVVAVNLWRPGFVALLAGTIANVAAIGLNQGMPVSVSSMVSAGYAGPLPPPPSVLSGVTHHAIGPSVILPLLADVMPLPGPAIVQSVVSIGDVLLACGVVGFLASSMRGTSHARGEN